MISAFTLNNNHLSQIHLEEEDDLRSDHPIWIDVVSPSEEERNWVEKTYQLALPRPEHLRDIEASARFYEDNGELHLRSDFLLGKLSDSRSVTVALCWRRNRLRSGKREPHRIDFERGTRRTSAPYQASASYPTCGRGRLARWM